MVLTPPAPRRATVWLTALGVSCFRLTPRHRARLRREVPGLDIRVCNDEAAFLAALPETDVAIVWRFQQDWFARAPRLKWIVTPSAGRDYFAVQPPPGVRMHYGSFHGRLMAETAVGMMLAADRGLIACLQRRDIDPWPRDALAATCRLLRGRHVVILGFGHIGDWIGRLVKPFGVRLTGIKRQPAPHPVYFTDGDAIRSIDELDDVLPDTDHLVIILPGVPETDFLINRRRLALMPSTAWVHNLGRGNAIDETALATALRQGTIAGACLDVFQQEPLPVDSPLRSAPNTLLLPHASAFAPDYLDAFLDEFIPLCQQQIVRK